MEKVIVKANAKINLTLDVISRRPDGYHLLDMIMHSVDIFDRVTIKKNYNNNIKVSCNINQLPMDETNSAYKAASLLMNDNKAITGVDIYIEKNIPIGAGMAGGSADAAALIVGLDKLFQLDLTYEKMKEIALNVGTDVPFCIKGGCVRATGLGEVMQEIDPVKLNLLIIKPKKSISTAYVYNNLVFEDIIIRPNNDRFIQAMGTNNIDEMISNMNNVLETVTSSVVDEIEEIKSEITNCNAKISMMTGSGTAVFGIFDSEIDLKDCYDKLKLKYEEIFISKTVKGGVCFESWD